MHETEDWAVTKPKHMNLFYTCPQDKVNNLKNVKPWNINLSADLLDTDKVWLNIQLDCETDQQFDTDIII